MQLVVQCYRAALIHKIKAKKNTGILFVGSILKGCAVAFVEKRKHI